MGEEVEKLVERLKRGAFGRPSKTLTEDMQQAATTLERVERERDEWETRAHGYEVRLGRLGNDLNTAEAQVEAMRKALEDRNGVAAMLRSMADEIWCQNSPTRPRLRAMASLLETAALSAPVEERKGDMVSRDHDQTPGIALEDAVARLRKDVVTGFASEYCVASRPALEIVLDALQRDDQDPLIWKLEVIQRSIEGDIRFAQDGDRNQPMTDDTFIIPRHWMPHSVAKNWIGVLSEAIERLKGRALQRKAEADDRSGMPQPKGAP